ncbi:hypothetical protein NF867_07135 [Solitalea sp. MAHUQ-68]|uniref:Uncharacterized protein n=1 Tax=Solitalea agri TaxID=2953739 RepID=A0A9X2JCK4_9SPHI|nr:hypothetical protein [Solitalea agri]MCO4292629.1 hypothetical protein [Solitalea agri]
MKPFVSILTFILTLPLLSYQHKVDKTFDLDDEKYLNFIAAVQNSSTFSYFTVIKVKNLNTGVIKEICTKGDFVLGALHIELKADYDKKSAQTVLGFAKSQKNRYFEFKNNKALDNISFFDYNTNLVTKIQTKYNFDKAIEYIKKTKDFSIWLSDDEMKAFAHVLFNKGYLTGENNCRGGTLEYVDRTK